MPLNYWFSRKIIKILTGNSQIIFTFKHTLCADIRINVLQMFYMFYKNEMITIKMLVRPERMKKDGTWNVNLRISFNRNTSYLSTPYYVVKQQMNKLFEVSDKFLKLQLDDDLLKARKEIVQSFEKLSKMSVQEISDHLQNFLYTKKEENINFFDFANEHIAEMINNAQSSAGNYGISIRKIKMFVGHSRLNINDITVSFLNEFDAWLKNTGVGIRGRALYLSNLRAIINAAKKKYNDEDAGIIRIPKNPFKYFSLPLEPATEKRALTLEQLKAFIAYEPKKEPVLMAKVAYLLSFYFVGMNSKDIYLLPAVTGERISYQRAKTKKQRAHIDGAFISIKIEPEAKILMKLYDDPTGKMAFNFIYRYSTPSGFNSAVNENLKEIGRAIGVTDLEFYSARHTWATLFVNKCGGSESEAAFCLNHVSPFKVTTTYIEKDFTRIDKANRKVIDLLI